METKYLHLTSENQPPTSPLASPFAAIVIIDNIVVTHKWRDLISHWLVDSGCLFMMAWGTDCVLWDDSVDYAKIDAVKTGIIPDEQYVFTTWHENESLEEVFWFAQHAAQHSSVTLERLLLLDVSLEPRSDFILERFAQSFDLHNE